MPTTDDGSIPKLITQRPSDYVTYEEQLIIDAETSTLPIWNGATISFEDLVVLRQLQEPFLIAVIHAQFRLSAKQLNDFKSFFESFRIQQRDELSKVGSSFRADGKAYRIVNAAEIRTFIQLENWLTAASFSTDDPAIRLGIDFCLNNLKAEETKRFTEATYRLFRLNKHILKPPPL